MDKRDLFKEGAITLEALSEATNGDADGVVMNPAGQLPKFFEAQPPANSADEESGLACAGGIVSKPPPDAALIALLSRVRRRRESRVRPGRQSIPDSNECRVDLQRFSWLVKDGFETSLKQGSDSTVFSIEPHTVADIKPMDRFAKVRLSALQLEMVVVTHQGVTVQPYPEPYG